MTNEIRKIQNNNIKVNDNNENVKNNSSYNHNVTDNDNHVSIDHNSHNNTSNTDNNTKNNTNNNDDNISDNTNNNDRRIINDHDNDNINNNENNGNHVTIAQVIVDNLINNDNHVISNNLVNNSNNDVVADHVGDNDANSITNSNNNNSDNNDDHVDHDNDNNTINDNLVIANSIHNNNNSNSNTDNAKLTLFYRNLMSSSYKEDEYIIRKIIKKGVHPFDSNEKINLLIYYKNFKSQQLLIKNSPNVKLATTQHSHVIYQFLCPHEDCRLRPSSYIGMNTTKLTLRLTCHLNIGAPNQHYHDCHNQQLSRKILEDNTKILMKDTNFNRLQILESLFINIYKPNLKKQIYSNFILPSSRNV
ncbi:hypothetical protein HELRODRAFT_165026 [Helobdella robusta]|uniref:Uncharacterized protein n=1 Tax=Helobdella robusta TaxID=6412 RepID=T1EW59_HELRO|nr:hypothetical protein HELRODRAFT_165026 [Helobdella robusta]ESN92894.1 hypothetical protein HELRODRAFT_165026 [Helobdella robusta]